MGRYSSGDKFKHQEDEVGDKHIRDENWSMLEIGTRPLLWVKGRKLLFELLFNQNGGGTLKCLAERKVNSNKYNKLPIYYTMVVTQEDGDYFKQNNLLVYKEKRSFPP